MAQSDDNSFYQGWRKYTVIAIGCIEIIIIIVFVLTELGNIASNFFLTNVFAGSWCGLITLINVLVLFITSCCVTGPTPSFISMIITAVNLVAFALLIAFDAVFIAQLSTCLLTSTCVNQSVSTTAFSYNMSQNFFTAFNSLNAFKTYTLSQSKYLFQTVQISFGVLGFVLSIVLLVIYIMQRQDTSNRVLPMNHRRYVNTPESSVSDTRSSYASGSRRKLYPQQSAREPQRYPGDVPWNARRKY